MRYCVMKGGEEGSEGKRRVMRETEVGKVISFPSCRVMDGRRDVVASSCLVVAASLMLLSREGGRASEDDSE